MGKQRGHRRQRAKEKVVAVTAAPIPAVETLQTMPAPAGVAVPLPAPDWAKYARPSGELRRVEGFAQTGVVGFVRISTHDRSVVFVGAHLLTEDQRKVIRKGTLIVCMAGVWHNSPELLAAEILSVKRGRTYVGTIDHCTDEGAVLDDGSGERVMIPMGIIPESQRKAIQPGSIVECKVFDEPGTGPTRAGRFMTVRYPPKPAADQTQMASQPQL